MALITAAILGFGLGARHAFETDHIAAVCALVSRDAAPRADARARGRSAFGVLPAISAIPDGVLCATRAGALWGAGHGAVVILAGSALIATGAAVPSSIAAVLDAAVAVMLVALGVTTLRGASALANATDHGHHHPRTSSAPSARRPFFVGLVHGASGTAALTLLVTAQIPVRAEALAFIVLFGVASVIGMAAAATLVAWPLQKAAERAPVFARRLRGASGLASIAAGLAVAWTVVTLGSLS